ncbi:MAG: sugar phosphate isomerase/epimerase, partial [Gemmatimonadetes bacterium]|nr:sugar phosphate isomerase/epimerase [Gemmatimonadota bacterium]
MQGRLSSPDPRRLQAFPWATWEEEFARARLCGLDGMEWLFEADRYGENPIWTDSGCRRIRELCAAHGVAVMSLCADYFMAHPFFRVTRDRVAASVEVLSRLIERAASVGTRTILVPVLEDSAVNNPEEADELVEAVSRCLPAARAHDVRLGVEAELPREEYLALVRRWSDGRVGAYYDTGNAAAKGYDVAADLATLAPVLCGVHLKDRARSGGSVPLGEGLVAFDRCFAALRDAGYGGPLVLQTAFGA